MTEIEYRFEYEFSPDEWMQSSYISFSENEALETFDKITRNTRMNWRMRKNEIVSTIVKTRNAK